MVRSVSLFPQTGAEPAMRVEKVEPGAIIDYIAFLRQCHQMNISLQASVIKPENLAAPTAATTD
jgi:hypothetical protein